MVKTEYFNRCSFAFLICYQKIHGCYKKYVLRGGGTALCYLSLLRLLNQQDVIHCWTRRSVPDGSTLGGRLGDEWARGRKEQQEGMVGSAFLITNMCLQYLVVVAENANKYMNCKPSGLKYVQIWMFILTNEIYGILASTLTFERLTAWVCKGGFLD